MAKQDGAPPAPRRLSVCLINPRYEPSFWGFDYALPLFGAGRRYANLTGALPALAALAPAHCEVTLMDESVEPIDFDALARFDVVGVTGMIVQAQRMREILLRLKALPPLVVIGGAYPSVAEGWFAGLADVVFVGEAEETWPEFLNALGRGEPIRARYQQADKTDMRKAPTPRFDLVKADRYQMAPLQFSRGCPFLCEFCDIITVFGRRPRVKSPEQMVEEVEAVWRAGFKYCLIADDNFIGNKKEAKVLLQALGAWQREHGYPLRFDAEASINLADEPELIELMVEANFREVFVGIETPRKASLEETRKVQNVRGDSLQAKIRRIRDGGLVVIAGFIVGFDNDDEAIFEEQYAFIQGSGIAQAAVALLTPIPTTPLYERLQREGRLDFGDPDVIYHPKLMSRATLKAGFTRLQRRLYEPEAYFARLFGGYRSSPAFRRRRGEMDRKAQPRSRTRRLAARVVRAGVGLRQAARLAGALRQAGLLRRLGLAYLKVGVGANLAMGRDALPFATVMNLCIMHWHFYNIVRLPRENGFGAVGAPEPMAMAA